jgi:anhydro-N-acetylmuramic acid kinase
MIYKVIGLMSGSSLDGLDICYTYLEETAGQWKFDIQEAVCIPYTTEWTERLEHAHNLDAQDFLRLHTSYGRYTGNQVKKFINQFGLDHKVHFVASHGHTVFHEPASNTSFQLGDGGSIAAVAGLPVISDLRTMDVALGGQGAPIVPIGDKLLFGDFDYCLNIGGIVNITAKKADGTFLAFDIGPGNQMLNALAEILGKKMDDEGAIAASGRLLIDVLGQMNEQDYYFQKPPKSLSNEMARSLAFPFLMESKHLTQDLLRTAVRHIAEQVGNAVKAHPASHSPSKMLITGGGGFNNFLVDQIQEVLLPLNVKVVVPYEQVVKYKEALVMALIGTLRWREEKSVLSSVTGASSDNIAGALWMV